MPSFPCAPFLLTALSSAALRTVFLDEAEHFLPIEMPASLRFDGVWDHPGMPFGFIPDSEFSFAGIPTLEVGQRPSDFVIDSASFRSCQ